MESKMYKSTALAILIHLPIIIAACGGNSKPSVPDAARAKPDVGVPASVQPATVPASQLPDAGSLPTSEPAPASTPETNAPGSLSK